MCQLMGALLILEKESTTTDRILLIKSGALVASTDGMQQMDYGG